VFWFSCLHTPCKHRFVSAPRRQRCPRCGLKCLRKEHKATREEILELLEAEGVLEMAEVPEEVEEVGEPDLSAYEAFFRENH
jgi:hypothetical protein